MFLYTQFVYTLLLILLVEYFDFLFYFKFSKKEQKSSLVRGKWKLDDDTVTNFTKELNSKLKHKQKGGDLRNNQRTQSLYLIGREKTEMSEKNKR